MPERTVAAPRTEAIPATPQRGSDPRPSPRVRHDRLGRSDRTRGGSAAATRPRRTTREEKSRPERKTSRAGRGIRAVADEGRLLAVVAATRGVGRRKPAPERLVFRPARGRPASDSLHVPARTRGGRSCHHRGRPDPLGEHATGAQSAFVGHRQGYRVVRAFASIAPRADIGGSERRFRVPARRDHHPPSRSAPISRGIAAGASGLRARGRLREGTGGLSQPRPSPAHRRRSRKARARPAERGRCSQAGREAGGIGPPTCRRSTKRRPCAGMRSGHGPFAARTEGRLPETAVQPVAGAPHRTGTSGPPISADPLPARSAIDGSGLVRDRGSDTPTDGRGVPSPTGLEPRPAPAAETPDEPYRPRYRAPVGDVRPPVAPILAPQGRPGHFRSTPAATSARIRREPERHGQEAPAHRPSRRRAAPRARRGDRSRPAAEDAGAGRPRGGGARRGPSGPRRGSGLVACGDTTTGHRAIEGSQTRQRLAGAAPAVTVGQSPGRRPCPIEETTALSPDPRVEAATVRNRA